MKHTNSVVFGFRPECLATVETFCGGPPKNPAGAHATLRVSLWAQLVLRQDNQYDQPDCVVLKAFDFRLTHPSSFMPTGLCQLEVLLVHAGSLVESLPDAT